MDIQVGSTMDEILEVMTHVCPRIDFSKPQLPILQCGSWYAMRHQLVDYRELNNRELK